MPVLCRNEFIYYRTFYIVYWGHRFSFFSSLNAVTKFLYGDILSGIQRVGKIAFFNNVADFIGSGTR